MADTLDAFEGSLVAEEVSVLLLEVRDNLIPTVVVNDLVLGEEALVTLASADLEPWTLRNTTHLMSSLRWGSNILAACIPRARITS